MKLQQHTIELIRMAIRRAMEAKKHEHFYIMELCLRHAKELAKIGR